MEKSNSTKKKTDQVKNPLSRRKFITSTVMTVGAISIVPRHVLGRGIYSTQ